MALRNIKPKKKPKPAVAGYSPVGDERKVYTKFKRRKDELFKSRNSVYGVDIDAMMKKYDKDYFNRVADIPPSELDPKQRPVAINNAFGKVQTALSILIANNPDYKLDESLQKYSANRELIRSLMKKSWRRSGSFYQFLLMVFNTSKRGWGVGRIYHRLINTPARFIASYDDKGQPVYETKKITKMDEVGLLCLNNHNTWIDEESTPYNYYSTRDWMWREVWHIDKVRATFPKKDYPNMKFVKAGGNVEETKDGDMTTRDATTNASKAQKKGMTEIYFYENQYDDNFIVEINGIMVVWEPLPQDHKRLSLVLIPGWNLRGADTIYGIGIIEEMELDDLLIDRILNMTLRQLLLSIAPPGFYSGTEDLENENMRLEAGLLQRTMNPSDINFLKIPSPGQEPMNMIQWLETKQEQKTGITKTLEGDIANIRASEKVFALRLSREAGLKRLNLPLKSIQYALEWEGRNRADLIRQVYSVFEVEHLASDEEIFNYLEEVGQDPAFYFIETEGGQEKFFRNKFKETRLSVEQDEQGNFMESENEQFFKIRPEMLSWEGDIWVDVSQILVLSEELEKLDVIRMSEIIIPLLEQPPEKVGKSVKQILAAFNKDPQKWLPDAWLVALYPQEEKAQPKPGTTPPSPETPPAPPPVTTPPGATQPSVSSTTPAI